MIITIVTCRHGLTPNTQLSAITATFIAGGGWPL